MSLERKDNCKYIYIHIKKIYKDILLRLVRHRLHLLLMNNNNKKKSHKNSSFTFFLIVMIMINDDITIWYGYIYYNQKYGWDIWMDCPSIILQRRKIKQETDFFLKYKLDWWCIIHLSHGLIGLIQQLIIIQWLLFNYSIRCITNFVTNFNWKYFFYE